MENTTKSDIFFLIIIGFLILFSVVILYSISPSLFPMYFFYIILSLVIFGIFLLFDFEIIAVFSKYFYVGSIVFLILPILIGQVTRGTVRWIPIGELSIQPAEIIRPFLLIYFAVYLHEKLLTPKRIIGAILLFLAPVILVIVQPSLGVAILTTIGFLGLLLTSKIRKIYFVYGIITILIFAPLGWKILKPYQKQRIATFINPSNDPYGSGYNVIQSTISIGSGKLLGKGLGKGVQTQLSFLPEKHTDFIFASVSEELGFIGAILLVVGEFLLLYKLLLLIKSGSSPAAKSYISAFFLTLFSQTFIHLGMNMGIIPVTGIPLPLVSGGGSSLLGTMIGLAICLRTKRKESSFEA